MSRSSIVGPDGKPIRPEPAKYKICSIEFPFTIDDPEVLFQSCAIPQYLPVQLSGTQAAMVVSGFVRGWTPAESLIVVEVVRALEARDARIAELEKRIQKLEARHGGE